MNNIFSKFYSFFSEIKHYFAELLILVFPILIGDLGHTLIGTTDILVAAKYNINCLAAISIANSILFTLFIFGLGIIVAVSIILSNFRGAKKRTKWYLLSTLIFSFSLAIVFAVICYLTKFLIPYFGFEQNLVPDIQEYIVIVSFSMFGLFFYEGIKQYLQSFEIVKFPNYLLLAAVIINAILDIIFVFGFGPIPAMGTKGAAIATLSVRSLMGLIMFLYIFRFIDFKSRIDFGYMRQLVKIGMPIGFSLLFEFLAFNIVTLLVGRQSGILAATHNILMTISSLTFIVPLAISKALSVKVAYFYGAKKPLEIKNFSISAFVFGVGFMAFAGIILYLFPKQVIGVFTSDNSVLDLAIPIVSIVAMYQIFDGAQFILGGVLKGFKMTKIASLIVIFSYWGIGAPVACILVYKFGSVLSSYWIAFAVSLFAIGFIEAIFVHNKYNIFKRKDSE